MKALLVIYQLQEKATLWQKKVKMVRGVIKQNVTWEKFQRYFKEKSLPEFFYDEKVKEFHEPHLGQFSIHEFIKKFTYLLVIHEGMS